ncbi:AEC family transporter [Thauera sp. CAU 1555]|uniref:AEC family transporter n=1 Tax=Thauera sedimentorum TaxID=2767595 RepID=A0ABR9BE83_9RHOO|nr:AEC family transporter [Thauera sedimentorum]MBC9072861.1 AEC family transporter [Thauera sedimentorum]MBD8503780.1 AEC family transporter [Thauera sedimentorum]
MTDFLQILAFSLSVTGPIFVILGFGVLLLRTGMLTDAFVDAGSRLVFNIALPALLFISISQTRIEETANFALVGYGMAATFAAFLLLEWLVARFIEPARDRGVVVQGAFRSNMGIIGLAYCVNAYGEAGLVAASLYLGLVTILFNVLSVITLQRSLHRGGGGIARMARGIATNPLIIGILAGLAVSASGLQLPQIALKSGQYFADLTLPLALLCTGASLNFRSLRDELSSTLFAAIAKLVAIPLLFVAGGVAIGFRGIELGVLLLMSSAPTAAASYVMVRAMGGNAPLAANIIALTTLGSLLTTSAGITVLRALELM